MSFAFPWQFAKILYFQAIKYRASGHGALSYRKVEKIFSLQKSIFQAICKSFFRKYIFIKQSVKVFSAKKYFSMK